MTFFNHQNIYVITLISNTSILSKAENARKFLLACVVLHVIYLLCWQLLDPAHPTMLVLIIITLYYTCIYQNGNKFSNYKPYYNNPKTQSVYNPNSLQTLIGRW